MQDEDQVEPQDPALRNSPKTAEQPPSDTADLRAREPCFWNGAQYSDGATVCGSGTRHKCWDGRWIEIGLC